MGECKGFNYKEKITTDNTYNRENMLSQDVWYGYFKTENCGEYIVLMVHGGCDIRGGYTKPHFFITDTDDLNFFDYTLGTIYCTGKDHQPLGIDFEHDKHWTTDDSCNWYEDGSCGLDYKNLEDMECKDLDGDVDIEGEIINKWEPGKVCVKDGVGYCPVCGAKLEGKS